MWQELVAGIIVALAALYAGAKYLPDSWRRAIVHRLSKDGRHAALVKWLDTSASCGSGSGSSGGSGCNSCNTCGPSEPAPPPGKGSGKVIKIHERR